MIHYTNSLMEHARIPDDPEMPSNDAEGFVVDGGGGGPGHVEMTERNDRWSTQSIPDERTERPSNEKLLVSDSAFLFVSLY